MAKMVPQLMSRPCDNSSPSGANDITVPVFGSQLVDKNSITPYSDATQVSYYIFFQFSSS
jgi:hypothetical protein